jgi:CRISPR-associated endonuclease/helicase Cas3
MALSDAAMRVWAKSSPQRRNDTERWLPLTTHLEDAAGIAGRLWDDWLPAGIRRQFIAGVGSEASARSLLRFLAGSHDIGKASCAFAVQVPLLRNQMVEAGLRMPRFEDFDPRERRTMPHGLAGHVILRRWLNQNYGWEVADADRLAVVVGGHHGIPPSQRDLKGARTESARNRKLLGEDRWREVQDELLDHMAEVTSARAFLGSGDWRSLPPRLQSLATAVVVIADWLASNEKLFPLAPIGADGVPVQPVFDSGARVASAWQAVGLPRPWTPPTTEAAVDAVLRQRFGLPEEARARPIQRAAVAAARRMDAPGLLILEAGMGSGKTEAALLAAEILAARTGAGGLMIALPTQATSDAMFRRVMAWQEQITEAEVVATSETAPGLVDDEHGHAVFLAHGKSWLNPDYARIARTRAPSLDIGRDGDARFAGAYVDAWLQGRKGILADFVVGTIDQVLFAALQSRHVALRHLGLARKVVVLDEVHSHDAFMGSYLHRALEWLGAYGVPVIALSATLPPALRGELVRSYQRGVDSAASPTTYSGPLTSGWDDPEPTAEPVPEMAPAVSSVASYPRDGAQVSETVPESSRELRIVVERMDDDPQSLLDLVTQATAIGSGCLVVIRNTVTRAQETFDLLADRFGNDVELLHSRFVGLDRKAKEARLVDQLGPPLPDGGRGSRPTRRRILVATQVVEQSLDLDFDLMITDLAPTDLLLQRMGRLHRHDRPRDHRPDSLRVPRVVIVGVTDWATTPPTLPTGSALVYGKHLLYRAAAQVLDITDGVGVVELPRQIAPLVYEAYGDSAIGPESWQVAMNEAGATARGERARATSRASEYRLPAPDEGSTLLGWLDRNLGDAESQGDIEKAVGRARVRDSEDSAEVLLVQTDSADQWRLLDHLGLAEDDAYLPRDRPPRWSQLCALAGCSVRIPAYLPRGDGGANPLDILVEELEQMVVDAWQVEPRLAGELIMPLDQEGRAELAGCVFTYDTRTGLEVRGNA